MEISTDVLQQLEMAQAQLAQSMEAGTPPVSPVLGTSAGTQQVFGAAGSDTAKHVLVDHYMTSSSRRLWAYADNGWRSRAITNTEEQGLAQIAYAANRVDVWWDNSNNLTIIRCWKTF